MLGAAGCLIPSRGAHRWLGWAALVLGIALFFPIADFFAALLAAIWIVVASVVLARGTGRRRQRADSSEASAPQPTTPRPSQVGHESDLRLPRTRRFVLMALTLFATVGGTALAGLPARCSQKLHRLSRPQGRRHHQGDAVQHRVRLRGQEHTRLRERAVRDWVRRRWGHPVCDAARVQSDVVHGRAGELRHGGGGPDDGARHTYATRSLPAGSYVVIGKGVLLRGTTTSASRVPMAHSGAGDFLDGSDGTRTRDLRRDRPVLVVPAWPWMSGDYRREQGLRATALRGLPGTGGSFRRPAAGCGRDAVVVSRANEQVHSEPSVTGCKRATGAEKRVGAMAFKTRGRVPRRQRAGRVRQQFVTPRGRTTARRSRRRRSGRRSQLPCRTP